MIEWEYKGLLTTAMKYYGWDVEEHEDKISSFIPDLSFAGNGIDGWAEVKYCDPPPTTLYAIDHWTRGQEDWLYKRGERGAGVCLLIVGTPELHIAWKSRDLHKVRHMEWDRAIRYTPYRAGRVSGLVHMLNDLLTARSRA